MKKSTTFFEAKFIDYTGLSDNSRVFAGAFVAFSLEFDVVKGVTKPVEFIDDFEMNLLVDNALRPGMVVSLSLVVGETAFQCRSCHSNKSNVIHNVKKSTTFFEVKFIENTGLLENSRFFAGAVVGYSPGFDFVAKGVTEPVEFIDDLEMMLLDCNTLRPGLVVSLSLVVGETAIQCRSCYCNHPNAIQIMKKSTTFFRAKFTDYTSLSQNSHFFVMAIAQYIPGFDVVVMDVTEPVQFIDDLGMKLLDCNILRSVQILFGVSRFHIYDFTHDVSRN